MELFSIRIQRTFQLVSTSRGTKRDKILVPFLSRGTIWGTKLKQISDTAK